MKNTILLLSLVLLPEYRQILRYSLIGRTVQRRK